jgi:solute carrier family 25 iron transporter 28/37
MHFATYEFCKRRLGGSQPGHHPFITGLSGICATTVSDAILTPMDAVKQRLQLRIRDYKGVMDCLRVAIKQEGVLSLYASYTTTLIMNVPFHAIYFASYESLRTVLKRGSEQEFDPIAHLLAGAGAGSAAAAFTNPMDVAKTRLQTQIETGTKYTGMLNTMLTIWKEEGRRGFTRGIQPRIVFHSVSSALCWFTYEFSMLLYNIPLLITYLVKYALPKIGIGN